MMIICRKFLIKKQKCCSLNNILTDRLWIILLHVSKMNSLIIINIDTMNTFTSNNFLRWPVLTLRSISNKLHMDMVLDFMSLKNSLNNLEIKQEISSRPTWHLLICLKELKIDSILLGNLVLVFINHLLHFIINNTVTWVIEAWYQNLFSDIRCNKNFLSTQMYSPRCQLPLDLFLIWHKIEIYISISCIVLCRIDTWLYMVIELVILTTFTH